MSNIVDGRGSLLLCCHIPGMLVGISMFMDVLVPLYVTIDRIDVRVEGTTLDATASYVHLCFLLLSAAKALVTCYRENRTWDQRLL